MKKLLLSLLLLVPTTSLIADMQFDAINNRFYSSPMTPDIDQNEYHNLWVKFFQIVNAWGAHYGVYGFNFLSLTNFERTQLRNLFNDTAAYDNLKNRLDTYFSILGTRAQFELRYTQTILRFYLDVKLSSIMC